MTWFFGSFFPNLGIWIQDSRTAGRMSSMAYFLNFLKDKDRRFKTNLTLSLILWFNLRLEGYSIWGASSIAPHIKEDNYSRHEHLIVLMHPRKYSEGTFKMKFEKTWRYLQKYSEAYTTRLRRARGLVRPGDTRLRTWRTYSRIWDETWPTPYNSCNYSYRSRTCRNRRKLHE
jgi:hypothetical protein